MQYSEFGKVAGFVSEFSDEFALAIQPVVLPSVDTQEVLSQLALLGQEHEWIEAIFWAHPGKPWWLGPPQGLSESRRNEWFAGRSCLIEMAKKVKAFRGSAPLRASLAHSRNHAIGVTARGVMGIGVDIEPLGRTLSREALDRVRSSGPESLLRPIELWVVKEACFKAHGPDNQHTIIAQYEVVDFQSKERRGKARFVAPKGEASSVEFQFALENFEDGVLAVSIQTH